jgi:hypothetical protein
MSPETPRRKDGARKHNTYDVGTELASLVQCPGFRCLAYRDEHGRWRDAYSHELLPEVLSVLQS